MEKREQELREAGLNFMPNAGEWEVFAEHDREVWIKGAISEAAKNYHQSEADREIERLKAELSKERDFNHVAENHLGNANNAWQDSYKILQQKYDALKEKVSQFLSTSNPSRSFDENGDIVITYEKIQKEAKDGE